MKTRITELFGIEYPIVQGAMQWLSKPNLAAAVSNAGGLGTINMTTYADPEDFQKDIQRLKRLTDKPFSVNLSLLPDTKPDGPIKGFLQAIVDEKVRIVETAGSSPKPFMDLLKGAGCVVMHKIPDSRFAHTAEEVTNAFELALAQPDIGMILVTEKIADDFTEIVNDAKKDQEGPLVLAIPDRHGSALGRDRITRYVREAIGVKI